MRGGHTDTPMMLYFCLRFPRCINELLKRVTGTSYRYFTDPVASCVYLQPTLGDVDINFCDLAKLPKPLSGCLFKKQLDEIRQWVQQYGKSVRQNTTRNFSTKDKPGTLLLNLYESAPPAQHSDDFDVLLNEDIPVQHQDTSTARNIVIAQSTYVVVSRIYKSRSAPNSPLYNTKLLEDVVDDYDSARYVTTLCCRERWCMDKVTRIRSPWMLADRKGSGRGQWTRSFSFIKIWLIHFQVYSILIQNNFRYLVSHILRFWGILVSHYPPPSPPGRAWFLQLLL